MNLQVDGLTWSREMLWYGMLMFMFECAFMSLFQTKDEAMWMIDKNENHNWN